eukprot:scaffold178069_cov35-Prasinocladus_malaysianus.AAC.2
MYHAKRNMTTIGSDFPGIHRVRPFWVPKDAALQEALMQDPNTMRIMLVRNPYIRILSAFLDKGVHAGSQRWQTKIRARFGGPYEATSVDFVRFLRTIISKRKRGSQMATLSPSLITAAFLEACSTTSIQRLRRWTHGTRISSDSWA